VIDTRTKILVVLPFCILVAAVLLINAINLEHRILRPGQRQLLHFSPDESVLGVDKTDPVMDIAPILQTSLFNFDKAQISASGEVRRISENKSVSERIEYGVTSASVSRSFQREDVLPNLAGNNARVNPKLTFIVLNGRRSFAIVDDRLLHAGETTGGMTIQMIEKNRILIKDKTVRWIYMEEER